MLFDAWIDFIMLDARLDPLPPLGLTLLPSLNASFDPRTRRF